MSTDALRQTENVTTAGAPILTVGDLRLVPVTEDDADELVEGVRGDEAVARYSTSLSKITDRATALHWMTSRRREGHIDWVIRDADGHLLGRTALHDVDLGWGRGEVGYTVFAAYRRRGVATRVTQAVTRYAFDQLGLARIELLHAVGNDASCGVAWRCGFALEGEQRSGLIRPTGGREDSHLHARLRDDPPGPLPTPPPLAPVELIGEGLRLRPWHETDADFVLAAMSDPAVRQWNPLKMDGHPIASLSDAQRLCVRFADWSGGRRGRHCSWVVCAQDDDRALGHVSLYALDGESSSAGVGYWVAPEDRGRGLASRAVRVAVAWAYPSLALRRIELFHAVDNPASCAVARSAGFALEGTMRASYRYGDGELHDEHAHARLAED